MTKSSRLLFHFLPSKKTIRPYNTVDYLVGFFFSKNKIKEAQMLTSGKRNGFASHGFRFQDSNELLTECHNHGVERGTTSDAFLGVAKTNGVGI